MKHIIIETDSTTEFEELLDKASKEYSISSIQSHVTFVVDKLVYTALVFYDENFSGD